MTDLGLRVMYYYSTDTLSYNSVSSISKLSPGCGYWIYLFEDELPSGSTTKSYSMQGLYANNYDSVTLGMGWNLIGPVTQEPIQLGGVWNYYWDTANEQYLEHEGDMTLGLGYWMYQNFNPPETPTDPTDD